MDKFDTALMSHEYLKTRDRRQTRIIARTNRQIFFLEEDIYSLDEDIVLMTQAGDLRAVQALRDLRDTLVLLIGKLLEFTVALSGSYR